MSIKNKSEIAEMVGRQILERKGYDLLQLLYLLEEKNAETLLWSFVTLNRKSQKNLMKFMTYISSLENIRLRVDRSGLHIEEE